jgi:hypothetical protein
MYRHHTEGNDKDNHMRGLGGAVSRHAACTHLNLNPRLQHEQSESELYQTVVHTRQEKLRAHLKKVAGQKAFLRHEKRRLLLQRALLESEQQRFQASLASDWFCEDVFHDSLKRASSISHPKDADKPSSSSSFELFVRQRLRLHVGGQDFEVRYLTILTYV